MNVLKKIILGVLAAVGIFYIGFSIYTAFFASIDCTTYRVAKIPSPGKKYLVKQEKRECRSQPGVDMIVWVLEKTREAEQPAFVAPATVVDSGAGKPMPVEIGIKWISDTELLITYPQGVTPKSAVDKMGDVAITYQTVE